LKLRSTICAVITIAALSTLSAATTLTGTVTNGTTGKPAAGDDVVLLQLSQGMNEQARTKTDAQGHFKFDYSDDGGPHLVRVLHQGVNYFPKGGPIMPGASSTSIDVYDVAKKLDNIGLTVDMMRLQTDAGMLQVTELWAVNNTSNPPRTLMNDYPFEIELPAGAQIASGMAAAPGGQPLNSTPAPTGKKDQYAFIFPLRPGETRFQVAYQMPYSGQATIHPKLSFPTEHVVVMLPKTMQFASAGAASYQSMGEEEGGVLQVSTKVAAGQDVSFKISGTGTIQETQAAESGGAGAMTSRGRPGGGLGPPEETPDPLHRYRWYILGGLAVALALGAFYVVTRPQAEPSRAAASPQPPAKPPARSAAAAADVSGNGDARSARLLEALKEELFQLELDRHQGRISQAEYEKSKSALDHTIARAAARKS
jgi:hypothetical protein